MNNHSRIYALIFVAISFLSFLTPPYTIYGDFKTIKMQGYADNTLQYTFYNSLVKLYPEAVDPRMVFKSTNVGAVSVNMQQLKYNKNIKSYLDSTERTKVEGVVWSVGQNPVFNGFTYNCSMNYPNFTNIQGIPDTINKHGNFEINFTGVQNSDFVEFIFDDFSVHIEVPWYRKVNTLTNNSLVIPGENFSSITVQKGFVRLVFTKRKDTLINEKMFRFENRLMLVKPVVVLN